LLDDGVEFHPEVIPLLNEEKSRERVVSGLDLLIDGSDALLDRLRCALTAPLGLGLLKGL
jgi:hypothetical protein